MEQFQRLELLIGKENLNKINKTTIMVIGVGGVGSYCVESLIRSGIGKIILVDFDTISITNINRQIMADLTSLGKSKTSILKNRIKNINPNCEVIIINKFIDKENIDLLFNYNIDYLIDAEDTMNTKKLIIEKCLEKNIKFITCMGTGNKLDPSKLEINDIRKTNYDPLAKKIRGWINKEKIKGKIICCYSKEESIKTSSNIIGSTSFVPASAGLLITSFIIKNIIKSEIIGKL